MKIRTITTGISLESPKQRERIIQAADFNQKAKDLFEQQGYEVQTTRIATNSWAELSTSTTEIITEIQELEQICQNLNVSFFSIGYISSPEKIAIIPESNQNTPYCSLFQ